MDAETVKCRLCTHKARLTKDPSRDLVLIEDCLCGPFIVTRVNYDDFVTNPRTLKERQRFELSALLRESNIKTGLRSFLQFGSTNSDTDEKSILIRVEEALRVDWPATVPERLDRILCNLGRMSPEAGFRCPWFFGDHSLAFARTSLEASTHEDYLKKEGYVERVGTDEIFLTSAGWYRFSELTRGVSSDENPVFVAMWFGGASGDRDEMNQVYSEAIAPAIINAGYKEKRADTEEHNNFIMDEILGSIRMAPFVVADFTGNRGGVYLEAGFARGLGLPVIHTCKQDHFDRTHFDIKQLNTIQWSELKELRDHLYNRIVATVGVGPYKTGL